MRSAPGRVRVSTRRSAWRADTSMHTPRCRCRRRPREGCRLLAFARLRLEPRECALPARRRPRADRPRPPGNGLRAARRLEPREPGRRARNAADRRVLRRVSGVDEQALRPRHTRPRRGAGRRRARDRARVERSAPRAARRPPPRSLARFPAAVPRHAPPLRDQAQRDDPLRPTPLRRRAGLRRGHSPDLREPGLGGARLDLARGGGRPPVPAAARPRACRGARLDRELGRRRADERARGVPPRAGADAWPDRIRVRRSLPAGGARGHRGSWSPVPRLGGESPRSRDVRPARRHGARPAPPVRRGAARHPDDPPVRGPRLRHPADLLAVGRRGRAVHARRGLPDRPRRRRDGDAAAACVGRPRARTRPRAVGSPHDSRAPHVRPPRRRAARDRRGPGAADRFRGTPGRGGQPVKIAFFGSSLVSAYWNGAATYYRGLVKELHRRGHRVTFFEPDAFDRQAHRDIVDPPWAEVIVYPPEEWADALERARGADVVVKASGVGTNDSELATGVLDLGCSTTVFWDVDAPATLAELEAEETEPLRALIPRYDLVLTYGGGDPVVRRYRALGASECIPVYNAV